MSELDYLEEIAPDALENTNQNVQSVTGLNAVSDLVLGHKLAYNSDLFVNAYSNAKAGKADSPSARVDLVDDANKQYGLSLKTDGSVNEEQLSSAVLFAEKDRLAAKQIPKDKDMTFFRFAGGLFTPESLVDIPLSLAYGTGAAIKASKVAKRTITTAEKIASVKSQGNTLKQFFDLNKNSLKYNLATVTPISLLRNQALEGRGVSIDHGTALTNLGLEMLGSQVFSEIGTAAAIANRKKYLLGLELQQKVEDFMLQKDTSGAFFTALALDKKFRKNHEISDALRDFVSDEKVQEHLAQLHKVRNDDEAFYKTLSGFDNPIPPKILREMDRVLNEKVIATLDNNLRKTLLGVFFDEKRDSETDKLSDLHADMTDAYLQISRAIQNDDVVNLSDDFKAILELSGYKLSDEEIAGTPSPDGINPRLGEAPWSDTDTSFSSNYLKNELSRSAEAQEILGAIGYLRKRLNELKRAKADPEQIKAAEDSYLDAIAQFEDKYARQFRREVNVALRIVKEVFGYEDFDVKQVVPPLINGRRPKGYTVRNNTDDIFISRAEFWYSRGTEGYTPFQVVLHEAVHNMRKLDPKSWKKILDIVERNPELKSEFDRILEANNYKDYQFRDEYPSWIVEWAITKKQFWKKLRQQNPKLYTKFGDMIVKIFRASRELIAGEFRNIDEDMFTANTPEQVAEEIASILSNFKANRNPIKEVKDFLDARDVELTKRGGRGRQKGEQSEDPELSPEAQASIGGRQPKDPKVEAARTKQKKIHEQKQKEQQAANSVTELDSIASEVKRVKFFIQQQRLFMQDPGKFHMEIIRKRIEQNIGSKESKIVIKDLFDFTTPISESTRKALRGIGLADEFVDSWFVPARDTHDGVNTILNALRDEDGIITLDRFLDYLNTYRDKLPDLPTTKKARAVDIRGLLKDKQAKLFKEDEDGKVTPVTEEDDIVSLLRDDKVVGHFGNPWSHIKNAAKGVIKVETRAEATRNYEDWLLGRNFTEFKQDQRQWILGQINSGALFGKTLYHTDAFQGGYAQVIMKLVTEAKKAEVRKIEQFQKYVDESLLRQITYILSDQQQMDNVGGVLRNQQTTFADRNAHLTSQINRLMNRVFVGQLMANLNEGKNLRSIIKALKKYKDPKQRFNALKSFVDGELRNTGETVKQFDSIQSSIRAQVVEDQTPLIRVLHETGMYDLFMADTYEAWIQVVKDLFVPGRKNNRMLEKYQQYKGKVDDMAFAFMSDIMEFIRTDKVPKRLVGNKDALRLAKAMRAVTHSQLGQLNVLGYSVQSRRDFNGWSHRWSPEVAREVGFEQFRKDMLEMLDMAETARLHGGYLKVTDKQGHRPFDPETFIKEWYKDLTADRELGDRRQSHILKPLISPRLIKIKPEFEAVVLRKYSGEANLGKLFFDQVRIRSERIALAQRVSSTPLESLLYLAQEFKPGKNAPKSDILDYNMFVASVRQITGDLDNPVDAALSGILRPLGDISDIAFLPTSGFATLSDLPTIVNMLKYQGVNIGMFSKETVSAYVDSISRRFGGDKTKMSEFFELQGAAIDIVMNGAKRRILVGEETKGGFLNRIKEIMFGMNGLLHSTASHQEMYVDLLSRYLAIWARDNNSMPVMTQRLKEAGFNDADLANLSKSVAKDPDGTDRVVPTFIENLELRQKLRRYILQAMNDAVLMPNASSKATARLGTTSGTPLGEAANFVMRYSVFPIAQARQNFRRFANGYRGDDAYKIQQMQHFATWVGTSLAFAYMATIFKDLSKFKEPINLFEMTAFDFERILYQSGITGPFEYMLRGIDEGPKGVVSPLAGLGIEVGGDVLTGDVQGVVEQGDVFFGGNMMLIGPAAKEAYSKVFVETLFNINKDMADSIVD